MSRDLISVGVAAVLIALLAFGCVSFWKMKGKAERYDRDTAALKAQIVTLNERIATRDSTIELQNAAIKQISEQSMHAMEKGAQDLAKLATALRAKKDEARLMRDLAINPTPEGKSCLDADREVFGGS